METEMEVESDEVPTNELTEADSDNVLGQIDIILRPLCHSVNIVCERKVCNFDKSEFLRIYNPLSDKHHRFFPALELIVFITEGTLGLRVFLEHKKVFKESYVNNIEEQLSNPDEYLGLVTVLSAFLSELSVTKYDLCRGAFEESSFDGDLSTIDIQSVLIENDDSRIIYRSRKCYLLVREGTQCKSCTELLNSSASPGCNMVDEKYIKEEAEEENPLPLNNDNGILDSLLEVSMDESWRSTESGSSGRPVSVRELKRPKMSYKKLIFSALMDTPSRRLKLPEIYDWILERYPSFRANKNGFQNSIRHNLSLNKMFIKVDGQGSEVGRGGFWTVDPYYLSSYDAEDNYGRPKIHQSSPVIDPKGVRNGISTKGLMIEGIASNIQAMVASTSEAADCDPLQVSYPLTCKSVSLNSRINQDECGQESRIAVQEGCVIAPDITITSVPPPPSHKNTGSSQHLTGKHFLNNLLTEKLKTILPKPTNGENNQKIIFVKSPKPKPAPFLDDDNVEVSEYSKPCFSYKELIMLAIFSDPSGAICLNDIYKNIRKWFPYFRQRNIGLTWQNSIRHNLSLNKCFRRLDNNGAPTKVCLNILQIFMLKVYVILQGGSWSFDTTDDTWKKLMSTQTKWRSQRFEKTYLYDLCELLSVRNEDFASHIFPALIQLCPSFYDEQPRDPLQVTIKHEGHEGSLTS